MIVVWFIKIDSRGRKMASLVDYLNSAKSSYHVVKYAENQLIEAGFTKLEFGKKFDIKKGGAYYCIPQPTMLYAFTIGQKVTSGKMHISCAHTDSPTFKIKPEPEMGARANAIRINTEPYGGSLKRTWFDRPLCVAGQVVVKAENAFMPTSILFDSIEPWFIIPSLAPHMDREIEEKKIDPQKELIPLFGISGENYVNRFIEKVAEKISVSKEDILDFDLELYVGEKSVFCGKEGELLLGSRIDNIASVAACVEGIIASRIGEDNNSSAPKANDLLTELKSSDENEISLVALFDNEEIGSRTKQGADSMSLSWLIEKIFESECFKNISKLDALSDSKMLSMDGAHAVHPNYPEKADETTKAVLGNGIVLKTSASQRYVTDARMSAIVAGLCEECEIKYQKQANKSGTPGGQTLGPIESSYLPIMAADLGVPMLAMHSAKETMCINDYNELLKLSIVWNRLN